MSQQNQNQSATPQPTPQKPNPKIYTTIDGNTLMAQWQECASLQFTIEKILPTAFLISQVAQKSAKSTRASLILVL